MTPVWLSPECSSGNCHKCDGDAWDEDNDQLTECGGDFHQEES